MNGQFSRLLPLAAFALAACDSAEPPPGTATEATIPLFKEGKGVLFSDETRKLFGLEIADATERPMQHHLEKTAEVYRAASPGNPGAALVRCRANEAHQLTPGQPVVLRRADGPGPEIAGKLARIDTQAQAALDGIEVLLEFADPLRTLDVGALVTARFLQSETQNVLTVPATALLDAADGSYVYTVNGTHLTRTHVKAGAANDGFVAIEDGLYAGDVVATRGVNNLWLVELSALKGGTPCCPAPKKETAK